MPKMVLEFDCSCFGYLYHARYLNLNVGMYEILNFSRNHRFFVVFFTLSPKMGKTWNINLKYLILPLYGVFEQNMTSIIKSSIGPKMALTEPSPLKFLLAMSLCSVSKFSYCCNTWWLNLFWDPKGVFMRKKITSYGYTTLSAKEEN